MPTWTIKTSMSRLGVLQNCDFVDKEKGRKTMADSDDREREDGGDRKISPAVLAGKILRAPHGLGRCSPVGFPELSMWTPSLPRGHRRVHTCPRVTSRQASRDRAKHRPLISGITGNPTECFLPPPLLLLSPCPSLRSSPPSAPFKRHERCRHGSLPAHFSLQTVED